jgi:hypothetical protein
MLAQILQAPSVIPTVVFQLLPPGLGGHKYGRNIFFLSVASDH